jgi:type IV pilus biogenesis protein CpaD/CtpE
MSIRTIQITIALGAIALSTIACTSSTGSARLDENFGDAVRSNAKAQLYDPAAASNPSPDPVEGTDGQRMEAVMEAHRGHKGSAESVSNPIVINVGQ